MADRTAIAEGLTALTQVVPLLREGGRDKAAATRLDYASRYFVHESGWPELAAALEVDAAHLGRLDSGVEAIVRPRMKPGISNERARSIALDHALQGLRELQARQAGTRFARPPLLGFPTGTKPASTFTASQREAAGRSAGAGASARDGATTASGKTFEDLEREIAQAAAARRQADAIREHARAAAATAMGHEHASVPTPLHDGEPDSLLRIARDLFDGPAVSAHVAPLRERGVSLRSALKQRLGV